MDIPSNLVVTFAIRHSKYYKRLSHENFEGAHKLAWMLTHLRINQIVILILGLNAIRGVLSRTFGERTGEFFKMFGILFF